MRNKNATKKKKKMINGNLGLEVEGYSRQAVKPVISIS